MIKKTSFHSQKNFSRYEFLLKNFKSGKILDLGNLGGVYGEGESNSSHLKFIKNIDPKNTVYGFDLFKPKHPKFFPNQKQGNIEKGLPYEDNYFDTVYTGELLEHINNPGIVLLEINRVLKKNGVFILDVPNPYSLFRLVKYLIKREEDLCDPTHLIFYTPASLHAILEKNNFKIQILATKSPKHHRFLPCWLTKGLGNHLLVVAKPF